MRLVSRIFALISCGMILLTVSSCTKTPEPVKKDGLEKITFKVLPFKIEDVTLLDGQFKHATELNEQILLSYEPDRLLAKFRSEAGLKPKAKHYGGWEDETIAGHSLGHYLSAITLMYESTGNEEFKRRANYIVDELYECQQADGDGYIGAFPNGKRILEDEVAKGNIRAQGFDLNGIWVPYYTEHKVMDGLDHVYKVFGNEKALEINIKFADWLATIVKDLNDDQIQEMLHCEHGGINETLAELYNYTGDEKYLKLSRVFQHKAIIDPIEKGEDILAGKHANTQIPKFVGLARRYELTGDQMDHDGAVNFWNMMVHHHSYVTGGNGNHEYLTDPDKLNNELSNNTTETCNVYNMLKLSEHLFEWTADPAVMEYYERALFNHIRSSQHPESGHVIYNLSIDMGGFKVYQDPEWFTCCVGTGMENHSKYSKNIYYHNNEELYLVQFIASELNWKEKGLKVKQLTAFPEEEGTKLEFECENPVQLALQIRYPHWALNGIDIKVNGKSQNVSSEPGSFVKVDRKWKTGDVVEISFPFSLRLETMPDNKNRVAVFNGPVVLAGDLGPVPDPESKDPLYVPVLMTKDVDPSDWLVPVEGKINTFKLTDVAYPREVVLKPFYRTHDRHYTIFWDTYTPEEWKEKEAEYKADLQRKKELEAKTIDMIRLGEMQPERNHKFRDERTWVDEFKERKYREVNRGGWMSFQMKINKDMPTSLVLEYWGGYNGSKTFDILVNDKVIATENISAFNQAKFMDMEYKIPEDVTSGKDIIEVKLVPHKGHRAGPLFTARTINN
ncbi:beta-L-arabinofuranosidase domain-containing protein [Saccharicrinis sp. FJH54]|uniref:beta-L-arabinofuranosidase domain-containing protein n=1 Tax=Saccharicrinis sp. FJH54 TaxID=3344665 RepID=UPI0035D3E3FE